MTAKQRLSAEQLLAEKLQGHKGEWVAIRNADIVATAPTRKQLREQISLRDIDSYFEVTREDDSVHIL